MDTIDEMLAEKIRQEEAIAAKQAREPKREGMQIYKIEEAEEEKPNLAYLTGATENDPVNHPDHYNQIPGIECIDVTQHFTFCLGNVVKYVWRAEFAGNRLEDLLKARWYLEKEIDHALKSRRDALGP